MQPSQRPIRLAALCLALLATSTALAQDKDPIRLDNIPTFESTSPDPVILRYKMKTGQVEKLAVDIDMTMKLSIAGEQLTMKQTMRMEAKAAVTAVDAEGNISAVVKITRMTMKVTGPTEVEFDSDKPNDDPNFKALTAMIGVGIPCKMSPVGKMLETDLEPLRLAARRADNAALSKAVEDSARQMFDGTFIQLSETAVKAGDTYKAGTLVEDKTKIHMSYKIRSVSGDKGKVLLEPVATLELGAGTFPEGIEAKVKSQRVAGWILFDAQKGHASKADIRIHMVLDISAMGQNGTAEITGKTTMTSTVE